MKFWFGVGLVILGIIGLVKLGWVGCVAVVLGVFAWLAASLAVGAFGFWTLLVVCVLTAWYVEAESWEKNWPAGLAVIPFAVFCILVHFVSKFNLIAWSEENWKYIASRVGLYFILGFLFFGFRWVKHVTQKRSILDVITADFRIKNGMTKESLDKVSDDVKFAFTEYLKDRGYTPDVREMAKLISYHPAEDGVWPRIGRNWRAVACWFLWWPFELPRYVLGELWADIVRALREFFSNVFDWFTKRYFGSRSAYVVDKVKFDELQRKNREKEYRR